jgi:DNA-binding NarL/FixJ family response regulator
MTQTTTGGGGTFHIGNTAKEIGLTQRGIIVATSEKRVYDWLCDYFRPCENNRYTVRHAETEGDFETLLKMVRVVMVFVEADFFGEKTIACLERIRKEKPRLRAVLFSVSARPLEDINGYLWRGADSFISLREKPELVREQMKVVFDGYEGMSEGTLNKTREYKRLSGIPPHLTVQELAVCRYAAREKERKEIASCLGICVKQSITIFYLYAGNSGSATWSVFSGLPYQWVLDRKSVV